MPEVHVTVDGRSLTGRAGQTVLSLAQANGIPIPNLCHDPRLTPAGACRLCLVEVSGQRGLVAACTFEIADGMVVQTRTDEIRATRKTVLELLFAEHRGVCTTCDKNGDCLLQKYGYEYQVADAVFSAPCPGVPAENFTTGSTAIRYRAEKCIRCGRCVRICQEVQMAGALTFKNRAASVEVSTAFEVPLNDSTCELCGQCISTCPTGAMVARAAEGQGQAKDLSPVRTTCTYCGVGCQMDLNVNRASNRVVHVSSPPGCVPNDGNLCVKGRFGFQFISSPERLTTPLIREKGLFRRASWEEALTLAAAGLIAARDRQGPDGIAFLSSARCTNEENYLAQKLARTAGRTNNIDQCATTCHAPTVAGLATSFGSGAMTNSIAEIRKVQTLFLIGANPTEAHPIIGLEMKKALARGARLIVCDPRVTWMAARAEIHLQHRPGTDNYLINAMMNHLVAAGGYDARFVEQRCEGFEKFRKNLTGYTVERAAEICGVEAELIRRAAEAYALGTPSSIFYTLGITEHTCGTENVQNLANLAMLCGQIGKESSGVNPLRGQNNVQGACDMGAIHSTLPGYQSVNDPAVREKFEKAWGVTLPTQAGGRVTDFIRQAGEGTLKGFFCMGEDPVLSEPNRSHVWDCLRKVDFIVCQDLFLTETAKLAHVVLPAACWAEKDGTFTNTERRVQRIRKAVEPPGEARADWRILCDLSTAMGYPMDYRHPSQIFDEIASLSPLLAGISYGRIEEVGLQWPCPAPDHPGTVFLHQDGFTRGKGLFHAISFRPPAEVPDSQYPLVLSTGRTLYHYNIGNMTRKTESISQKQPENFVEVHVDDAAALGIRHGDSVRVATRRGRVVVHAHVAHTVRPGVIWMPFHFAESSANFLTHDAFDTVTRTGEYKACAARLEKV